MEISSILWFKIEQLEHLTDIWSVGSTFSITSEEEVEDIEKYGDEEGELKLTVVPTYKITGQTFSTFCCTHSSVPQ